MVISQLAPSYSISRRFFIHCHCLLSIHSSTQFQFSDPSRDLFQPKVLSVLQGCYWCIRWDSCALQPLRLRNVKPIIIRRGCVPELSGGLLIWSFLPLCFEWMGRVYCGHGYVPRHLCCGSPNPRRQNISCRCVTAGNGLCHMSHLSWLHDGF